MGTDIMKHPVYDFIQRVVCFLFLGLGGRKHTRGWIKPDTLKNHQIFFILYLFLPRLLVKVRPFLYIDIIVVSRTTYKLQNTNNIMHEKKFLVKHAKISFSNIF